MTIIFVQQCSDIDVGHVRSFGSIITDSLKILSHFRHTVKMTATSVSVANTSFPGGNGL